MNVKKLLESKGEDVVSINVNSSVEDAIKQMNSAKISVIVVTENDKTVGLFTERDVVWRWHLAYFVGSVTVVEQDY